MSTPLDTLAAEFQIAWDDAVQASPPDAALDDDQVTAFVRDVLAVALRAALPQHRDVIAQEIAHQTEAPQELAFNAADAVTTLLAGGAA